MRISDWSSDVCSSDLVRGEAVADRAVAVADDAIAPEMRLARGDLGGRAELRRRVDRKSVVEGKSVSVRVDLGGRRIIKKTNKAFNRLGCIGEVCGEMVLVRCGNSFG